MALLAALAVAACAQVAPIAPDSLPDDLAPAGLEASARESLRYLEEGEGAGRGFTLAGRTYDAKELAASVREFVKLYKKHRGSPEFAKLVSERFEVLRSTGQESGKVLFTGYYEPVLEGSLKKEGPYRFPLYGRPPDLVEAELERFVAARQGEKVWGRVEGGKLVPYRTRDEIDFQGALDGKGLELAWFKSRWDVLNAQIQGSTRIRLPDGREVKALFDGVNGLPFRSPARTLVELGLLPKEKWSAQAAREWIEAHPEDERRILSSNARYAFFKLDLSGGDEGPLGTIKRPLTPWRSIAVDARLFPLGALCWYSLELPDGKGGMRKATRFALMQDTGGAIVGPGRVDLFAGRGDEALAVAGRVKTEGELYLILPKKK